MDTLQFLLLITIIFTHILRRRNLAIILNFYRAMLWIRSICYGHVSVRPPVRPSVSRRCSTKTAKRRINKQHHTIAHGFWFSVAKNLREIRPGSTPTWVGQNRRLFTNNRLYLENGTR